jgi:hypothetical protein
MFAPYCEAHGSRILLPTSAITALVSTEQGIVAHFTCTCGQTGIWRASEAWAHS